MEFFFFATDVWRMCPRVCLLALVVLALCGHLWILLSTISSHWLCSYTKLGRVGIHACVGLWRGLDGPRVMFPCADSLMTQTQHSNNTYCQLVLLQAMGVACSLASCFLKACAMVPALVSPDRSGLVRSIKSYSQSTLILSFTSFIWGWKLLYLSWSQLFHVLKWVSF